MLLGVCLAAVLATWLVRRTMHGELASNNSLFFSVITVLGAATRLCRGISVAIVGPPNAGKSTLANRLIGHDRVITSDVPGTTRDWVSETAMICGWPVTLTDTAGVRETTCEIETEAIARGTTQAHAADLIVIVLDAGVAVPVQIAHYRKIVEMIPEQVCRVVVFNKCDLAKASCAELGDACRISAIDGQGIDEFEKRVAAILGLDLLIDGLPTAISQSHVGDQPKST